MQSFLQVVSSKHTSGLPEPCNQSLVLLGQEKAVFGQDLHAMYG